MRRRTQKPLNKYWHDEPFPITRIRLLENGELLQTIEIAELARLAAAHPDTDSDTVYPEAVPYHFSDKNDLNMDGYNDLHIYFTYENTTHSYELIWDEETQRYVFQRINNDSCDVDA